VASDDRRGGRRLRRRRMCAGHRCLQRSLEIGSRGRPSSEGQPAVSLSFGSDATCTGAPLSRVTSVTGVPRFVSDFGRRRIATGSVRGHRSPTDSSEQVEDRSLRAGCRAVGFGRDELAFRGAFGHLLSRLAEPACSASRPGLRAGLSAGREAQATFPGSATSYWGGNARRALAPRGDRLLERETL
jgi:hypothetical protein